MAKQRYVPFYRREIGNLTVREYRAGWYQVERNHVPLWTQIPFLAQAIEIAQKHKA